MSHKQQIIFLRDKDSGRFKLRSDIKSFGFNEKSNQYFVLFDKGSEYLFYKPENVDIAVFSEELTPPIRVIRKKDNNVLFKVLGVRVFKGRSHKAYRVIFEGDEIKDYSEDYLTIEEHIDSRQSINVWEYLNEISNHISIKVDENTSLRLADKYEKTKFVAKSSLLEAYLNTESFKKKTKPQSAPIFPFGCNKSQYKAVQNALENQMSIIQGPPGTGKTQTILNILANLILDGKTMEIVSNNNSAIENVKEKLDASGLGYLCAKLGRVSNKTEFILNQTGALPEFDSWELNNAKDVRKEAVSLSVELQRLYEYQEKLAVCEEKLSEYKKQIDKFPIKADYKRTWPVSLLEKYFLLCSREMDKKHHLSWWTRFRLFCNHLPTTPNTPDILNYLIVSIRVNSLEKQCKDYLTAIVDIDSKNNRLRELSMLVLKDFLYRKNLIKPDRTVFSKEDISLNTNDFLREYPVVLSTTFSATSNINQSYYFDYLIMDEASQIDIASGALALSCARNAVVVGDLKQLPNVVDGKLKEIVDAVFAKYSIAEAYKYSTHSFLSSLCELYPDIPQTLLREHYRCNPLIIGFCSKQFYNGELIPMTKNESEFAPIRVVKTVKGNHARGTVNYRQIDTIMQDVLPTLEEMFTDIGIIAPYNKQVDAINAVLEASGKHYVAATVHKFQGRENDAIILSTVDNQIKEFADDPHLLNVAVSRARQQFTLVVSADDQPDLNIGSLIDYIEYYQGKSQLSQVSSIFDLLYEDYTKELLNFYKTHKRVSEYDSENIAYGAIQDTIKEIGMSHLGILLHYPLRHLISQTSNISSEQRIYASRSWTHVDFLIFDKVTHKAKYAIEVDGAKYHKRETDQGRRDLMKDSILKAIGIPLLRLSTVGSQEKEKIKVFLTKFC